MRSKRATKSSLRRVAVAGDGATLGNSGPDSVVNCEGVFGGFEAKAAVRRMPDHHPQAGDTGDAGWSGIGVRAEQSQRSCLTVLTRRQTPPEWLGSASAAAIIADMQITALRHHRIRSTLPHPAHSHAAPECIGEAACFPTAGDTLSSTGSDVPGSIGEQSCDPFL